MGMDLRCIEVRQLQYMRIRSKVLNISIVYFKLQGSVRWSLFT
eukprot:SAG22_NODE_19295_length_276_cov_0.587571_2_plen_42_part_01